MSKQRNDKSKKKLILSKKRKLKIFAAVFLAIIVLLIITVALVTLSALSKSDYSTPQNTDTNQVSPYLTHYLAPEFWEGVQNGKEFEILVKQDGFNDIIARDSAVNGGWPTNFDPMMIYAPQVIFEPEQLVIYGKIDYMGLEVYLTALVIPKLTDDGKLMVNVKKVQAGKLNVTTFAFAAAKSYLKENNADFELLSTDEKMIYSIINNQAFDPVFRIGDKIVRLMDFKLQQETLWLKFKPL